MRLDQATLVVGVTMLVVVLLSLALQIYAGDAEVGVSELALDTVHGRPSPTISATAGLQMTR
jgi:hypothetical protein